MNAHSLIRGIQFAGCIAGVAASLVVPATASGAGFGVTNTSDSGPGSLRQAIHDADMSGDPNDTIAISATGTVHLLSALPQVGDGIAITGPGPSQFTVSGEDTFQVIEVGFGDVSISGLTITHGICDSAGCGFKGGGLVNTTGNVTLTNVAVTSSNTDGQGGGIYNGGTMTLTGTRVNSNTSAETAGTNAFPEAGGIFNDGTLTLTNSTVSGNAAVATGATNQNGPEGGGIYNNTGATLNLDRSTVDSNHATADAQGSGGTTNAIGGGIINNGTLDILRSTISNNTSSGTNGTMNTAVEAGIANGANADVTIDRSTISGNSTTGSDFSQGGGLEVDGTSITITSSTIAHNSAVFGANLRLLHASTMKNTIVSDPQGGGNDCGGANFPTSQGYNIDEDGSCGLGQATDQTADPMLAANLAFNGGPTKTHALLAGSPAIDKGRALPGETVDQRSRQRPYDFPDIANASGGAGTDVGAFEVQPANTVITTGPNVLTFDPTPTFTFKSTEPGSTFQCRVDAHPFAACTSPRTLGRQLDGTHTFQVRAKDIFGNPDPSPASRTFNLKTAEVKRSGSTIVVTAAQSATDNFKVTRPSASTIRVTDMPSGMFKGSGVHVGPGCTTSGDDTADCSASGINALSVNSGSNSDRVQNLVPLPITIIGGTGYDTLIGGSRADTINGGGSADTLQGNGGNDTLLARDLNSDTAIDCGTGTADKADLDLLPKDSNVSGCETKTRH